VTEMLPFHYDTETIEENAVCLNISDWSRSFSYSSQFFRREQILCLMSV